MTGLRPQSIGVYDLSTHFRDAAPDVVTFSQYFKRNGYLAEGLGKIYHTGHGNRDDVDSWSSRSWRPKASAYVLEKSLAMRKRDAKGRLRGPATESADVPDETYADGLIAEEAVRRLEGFKKRTDQPFFLAVGFLKPSCPLSPPNATGTCMTNASCRCHRSTSRRRMRPATHGPRLVNCETTATCRRRARSTK